MKPYSNFTELSRNEMAGVDYRIHYRAGHTGIAIIAPHGGMIERGTQGIANAIAGKEHTYYCLEGCKPSLAANRILHIPSNHFDEPTALIAVGHANQVITVHGAKGQEHAAYAGGLDQVLRQQVVDALRQAGFAAGDDPSPTRQGRHPLNICNRGLTGKGLQLELTFGLRKSLFGPRNTDGKRRPTALFDQLVSAVRGAIDS